MLEKSGYTIDQQEIDTPTDMAIAPQLMPGAEGKKVSEPDQTSAGVAVGQDDTIQYVNEHLASSETWDERLKKVNQSSRVIAETFRMLRAKILLPQDGAPVPRTIMVTSSLPAEGKSFVTANLGIALAHGVDQHALLVDCDLRRPTLAKLFGISSDNGLSDYLQGQVELADLIRRTAEPKLSILTSGSAPANPAELLGSTRMHQLVDELSDRYSDRFVIFDTPPLQVASESTTLAQVVDGVILVVRHGVAGRSLIEKYINTIGKEKIIGVIFNGHKHNPISAYVVDKSSYYYGNYYTEQKKK